MTVRNLVHSFDWESSNSDTVEEKLKQFEILKAEANTVRENDKVLVRHLLGNFYNRHLYAGIGFQRAYGAILSGDYFDLIKLPAEMYLFVFADISGHGLPAYTTLVRLRAAITLSLGEIERIYAATGIIDTAYFVKDISRKFTDIMDTANSDDFACVNFTFIRNEGDRYYLKFYNRSMLFPIVVRKYQNQLVDIYNLNREEKGWFPRKGFLLGSDLRKLLAESYDDTPPCEFILYEGDSILFYSDGITEAFNDTDRRMEFGDERLEKILADNIDKSSQEVIEIIFNAVYSFIGRPDRQKDDMTAVMIDFPLVRD